MRGKLLLLMALMIALMGLAIVHGSTYAPVVGGVVEIETLWEIEDARQESETPLVTAMSLDGMPLAYDEAENTFYCPIGLDNGDAWPEMHLTLPGAAGVNVVFSDDYTYDYCADAVAEGYSYEMMAYDEDEYWYFYIVFTGLPAMTIRTDAAITLTEIPAHVTMAGGDGGLDCAAAVRLRGDGSLYETQKMSYRLSFASSRRNAVRDVPGLGTMETVNLVAMAFDDSLMHDRLSWDMINLITPQDAPFRARRTQYVELFVNGQYEGVYLMMEPIDYEAEIAKSGNDALLNDSLYRTTVYDKVRSNHVYPEDHNTGYEHFYSPGTGDPFAGLAGYLQMRHAEDDAAFEAAVRRYADVKSVMRYCALLQACGLVDNVQNNMFIWAHHEGGGVKVAFLPWDMDRSWGMNAGSDYQRWSVFPIADRMLNLNTENARQVLRDVWMDMKDAGFTAETVKAFVAQYEHELSASGALMRNAYRWDTVNSGDIGIFADARFALFDAAVEYMLTLDGPVPFLSDEAYTDWNIYVDTRLE